MIPLALLPVVISNGFSYVNRLDTYMCNAYDLGTD